MNKLKHGSKKFETNTFLKWIVTCACCYVFLLIDPVPEGLHLTFPLSRILVQLLNGHL